jgi:hypothetical protein
VQSTSAPNLSGAALNVKLTNAASPPSVTTNPSQAVANGVGNVTRQRP